MSDDMLHPDPTVALSATEKFMLEVISKIPKKEGESMSATVFKDSDLVRYVAGALYSTHSRIPETAAERYRLLSMAFKAMERDGKFNQDGEYDGDARSMAKEMSRDS